MHRSKFLISLFYLTHIPHTSTPYAHSHTHTTHSRIAYDDLESRKKVRAAAWATPGWDDCVAYTVPLIRSMKTRILLPMSFSPLQ